MKTAFKMPNRGHLDVKCRLTSMGIPILRYNSLTTIASSKWESLYSQVPLNTVQYCTYHCSNQGSIKFRVWTHKRHPIDCHNTHSMGYPLWGFFFKENRLRYNSTALYVERQTLYRNGPCISCHANLRGKNLVPNSQEGIPRSRSNSHAVLCHAQTADPIVMARQHAWNEVKVTPRSQHAAHQKQQAGKQHRYFAVLQCIILTSPLLRGVIINQWLLEYFSWNFPSGKGHRAWLIQKHQFR